MSLIKLSNYFKKKPEFAVFIDQEAGSADAELHAELVAFFALKFKDSQKITVADDNSNTLEEYESAMLG